MAIEALTRGIINKIMHTPITTLKSAARDPESTTVVDVVRKLFNLRAETPPEAAPESTGSAPAPAKPAPEPERAAVAASDSSFVTNQNRK
jgi:glutamyl-tRNA reductase